MLIGTAPDFGHPMHKPVDPRAALFLALADERSVTGAHVELAREGADAVHEGWAEPLRMKVSTTIAAALLDLDSPAPAIKAIPILAPTASLLAHLDDERENPIVFVMAYHSEEAIAYEAGGRS